jgi:enoyl-CoA hydratase
LIKSTEAIVDYKDYEHLDFERRENGVLVMYFNRPETLNATNDRMHWELTKVWGTIAADAQTRVVVVTGKGRAFSAGGDLAMAEAIATMPERIPNTVQEVGDIVYNMLNLDKPIISAINGVAVGAGLVVGLMADISIMAESAKVTDGHTRLGVVAGDHAAIIWPLLCGMAKAKYYLLTSEFISGLEAERIGLVSLCVPAEELMARALKVADNLGTGAQQAIRWTKRSLNGWIRMAGPIFDSSMALEILSFQGADVREGIRAIKEKRSPRFPSAYPSEVRP